MNTHAESFSTLAKKSLADRLYATLVFFDLFDMPLTVEQLFYYLPGDTAPLQALEETAVNDPRIQKKERFFLLQGREAIFTDWQERQEIAQQYWQKVHRYLPVMKRLPFISMIAVCNTLAFGSPTATSDIDLFIITRPGRIFTARVLLTLVLWLLGVRRHGKKTAGRFCLSFFIAEEAQNLEPLLLKETKNSPNDIYMAYWLKSLQCCYGADSFASFMQKNAWSRELFPKETSPLPRQHSLLHSDSHYQEHTWGMNGRFGNWIEQRLQRWHEGRFLKHRLDLGNKASIVVSPTMLKFHNIDRRAEFNQKFWEKL